MRRQCQHLPGLGGDGETVKERGFVVSTGSNPSVDDGYSLKFVSKDTKEAFTAQLTGLSCKTLYNIRAYATNNVGTWIQPGTLLRDG